NLMVGSVGEAQMNGVSISNQLMFVFNLTVFGGMSGAGIYAAQFFGANDTDGVRHSFRFMLMVGAFVSVAGILVFTCLKTQLLSLWINPDLSGTAEEVALELEKAEQSLEAGKQYLTVMLFGLVPFALTNAYASVLRVSGETRLPMYASVSSVFTNLVLNYLLIFDHFGYKGLGVTGAAIATVVARYVEMAVILIVVYRRLSKRGMYSFLSGAYREFKIPAKLFKGILIKSLPLLFNEALWSTGMSVLSQQYSLRGLTVVNAMTITSTLTNLFNVFFISMGTASSVMVGKALGANDMEGAKDNARKIIVFEEFVCLATCLLLLATSPWLPLVYTKSSADSKTLASSLIRVSALVLPLNGFSHCAYFTLRAGGKTFITFLFDSVYTWIVPVPMAYLLVHLTDLKIIPIYAIVNFIEIVKVALGYILLKKGVWIHNIVSTDG
ncbi:MAG: MATE family efflux transporter, partial [Clostridia bacterium]|nr:MATE family efflux transporter [Clostridia bacterium]